MKKRKKKKKKKREKGKQRPRTRENHGKKKKEDRYRDYPHLLFFFRAHSVKEKGGSRGKGNNLPERLHKSMQM